MVTVHGKYAQFKFFRPEATAVFLVGDFNGWENRQLRMVYTAGGYWVAAIELVPGTYKFRYFADGQWYADYAASGIEYGRFGPDSIVDVPLEVQPPMLQKSA